MKISTKGRYALRLMIDLALHDDGAYVTLKEISSRQNISIKYLEQIVTLLSRARFLKSTRGPQGGYRLVKPPEEYTAGDILRVTEGSLAPVSCLNDAPNQCGRFQQCSTVSFWKGLFQAVNQYVDSVTLKDLVELQREQTDWNDII